MGKRPLIVSEERREVTELKPPSYYRFHDWNLTPDRIELFISRSAMQAVIEHCNDFVDENLEVMGFFMGDRFKWQDEEYTLVEEIVTTDLDTTAVSVKFQREGFEKLFEQMEKHQSKYDYLLVGWYHSHPGHTCFMSETDVDTQTTMFKQHYQCAMVVDPINREMKAFKVDEGGTREIKVMVYDEAIWNHTDGDAFEEVVGGPVAPEPRGAPLVNVQFTGAEIDVEGIADSLGENYIAQFEDRDGPLELMVQLADRNLFPICVTVEDPEPLMEAYDLDERHFIWLKNEDLAYAVPATEIHELLFELGNFMRTNRETAIIIQDIEDVFASNSLADSLRFIYELNNAVVENNSRLIVPHSPLTVALYILANSDHIDITDEEMLEELDERFKHLFQQRKVKQIVKLRARKKSRILHEIEELFAPIELEK